MSVYNNIKCNLSVIFNSVLLHTAILLYSGHLGTGKYCPDYWGVLISGIEKVLWDVDRIIWVPVACVHVRGVPTIQGSGVEELHCTLKPSAVHTRTYVPTSIHGYVRTYTQVYRCRRVFMYVRDTAILHGSHSRPSTPLTPRHTWTNSTVQHTSAAVTYKTSISQVRSSLACNVYYLISTSGVKDTINATDNCDIYIL